MLNVASITGRMVKEPEIRQAGKTDNVVLDFTLAVQDDRKDKDGNYPAQFLDCQAWNQPADFLANYAHKGDTITVTGRIIKDTWKDDEGSYFSRCYIRADHVYINAKTAQDEAPEEPKKARKQYKR